MRAVLRPMLPCALLLVCLPHGVVGAGEGASAEQSLARLDWIAGDWRGDFDGLPFESHYTSPKGGTILSSSKLYSEGKCVFFEFERIHVEDDRVVYTPYPAGRAAVPFRLEGFDPRVKRAVFVNREHDFPTEITFESPAEGTLLITLKGPEGPEGERGKIQRVTFTRR